MVMVYLPPFGWVFWNGKVVGKYTIHMDPMGLSFILVAFVFKCWKKLTHHLRVFVH